MAATINSAAGHAALGSLPVVAMIGGVARAGAAEEQRLARFGLAVAVANVWLVGAASALLHGHGRG